MTDRARKIRPAVILAALVVTVVGGFLVGRAAVGLVTEEGVRSETARPTVGQATSAARTTPPPAVRAQSGPRSGRSTNGAAAAAATFSTTMIGVAFAGHGAREETYSRIATRRARAGLVALADSSQQVAQRNLAGGPGPVVLRVTPIGYRIVSFNPSRAVVDLWTLGIAGGRVRQPTASFGSTLVTLQWERGGWRLDAFQNGAGLTPNVAPTTANPAEVLADQDKYRVYGTLTP